MKNLETLTNNLVEIISSADLSTRAGRKACKRAKIAARHNYVAGVLRDVDSKAADERHYALLTANKAKTFAPVKGKKMKKGKKPNFGTGRQLTDWELYLAQLREEEKRSDAALAWAQACANEVSEEERKEDVMNVNKDIRRKEAETLHAKNVKRAKENAEGVLYLRKSGIWARRETISAKESARWMEMLLAEKESKEARLQTVVNYLGGYTQAIAQSLANWRKNINGHTKPFDASDEAYEVSRRKLENSIAREQMKGTNKDAMLVAKAFMSGLFAAAQMMKLDVNELTQLGCKKLVQAIADRSSVISQMEDQLFEEEDNYWFLYETSQKYDEKDLRVSFYLDMAVYGDNMRRLRSLIAEAKAERKLLTSALQEYREGADDLIKALIKAQARGAVKRTKKVKKPVGRQIEVCEKPNVKGYRLMSFEAENFVGKNILKLRKALAEMMSDYEEAVKNNKTQDVADTTVNAMKVELQKKFKALKAEIKNVLDSGESFTADSNDCRVNNARQSELADVIGIVYGKETDMIVTIEHAMANFLPNDLVNVLSTDPEVAQADIDEVETMLVNVLTSNGMNIIFHGEDGDRINHYRFWNAGNSELKVGKGSILDDEAYEIAKFVAQMGMSDEEFNKIPTNGSDMLKWWSYAKTPGCPLEYEGEILTCNDILVVPSITFNKMFSNVLEFSKDGKEELKDKACVRRTAFDGMAIALVPIPSQQFRGALSFKGYILNCAYDDGTNMVDEIAKREGRKVPDYIKDIDGKMRNWRNYKIVCSADCWKWSGYGKSYEEFCDRMTTIAETIPAANRIYTARIADATEESRRRLTRQSIQQMFYLGEKGINAIMARSLRKLNDYKTPEGILYRMAGLGKPESERTDFERLVEVAPQILRHPFMQKYVEDQFNRKVAEAASRPDVDGIYPYIAEDPVAFIKIVFFGEDPDKLGLGYLNADEVNIPDAEEGKEMYLVRYPNNYLCGMIAKNHNDDIYRCCGNTMILSADGYFLIRADGDVDGDEMCAIFDAVIIEGMKMTISAIKPPLIVFPHDKLEKKILLTAKERAYELAAAMVTANKFGPAVGQNSNLATRFMNRAAVAAEAYKAAYKAQDINAMNKARAEMRLHLKNAIVAHIAAIIAIDLAKTGSMPAWLQNRLTAIKKYAGSKMPWNQRFCKDNKIKPWFSDSWNNETNPLSDSVCDRYGFAVIVATKAMYYRVPIEGLFDEKTLLCKKDGLYVQGSDGKLQNDELHNLDVRNYLGDDRKIVQALHSDNEKDTVPFLEMLRFFWQNQASLMFKLGRNEEDKLDNAAMVVEYQKFVRNTMLRFGSYCGNDKFASLSPEAQEKSNIWRAVKFAFNPQSTIGKNTPVIVRWDKHEKACIGKKALAECIEELNKKGVKYTVDDSELMSVRASWCAFVVKIFARDIRKMVCENEGIIDIWAESEKEETTNESFAEFMANTSMNVDLPINEYCYAEGICVA